MTADCLFAILLLAPLVGSLINGARFRNTNGFIAGLIGTIAVFISFVAACALASQVVGAAPSTAVQATFFNWLNIGGFNATAGFTLDRISAVMILIVTGVGALIHVFSASYMGHDERPAKYFAYLNLFIFNMLLLVTGDNLLVMFAGWEGVGLCSYLLIGFWFNDADKAAAGMKAFITNRIGDAGFLLGIFTVFFLFGTLNFSEIISRVPADAATMWSSPITLACVFLFIGAAGKSAQIPLYVWLPDAMAGPTPVSALIHAATMVTAGVYMMVRLHPLFLAAPLAMHLIAVVGALTALLAATIGMAQWDIKKVLAYSTVSQLGYMVMACGVGAFGAGLFHLMTHAFFKALLFLGAGAVIHALSNEQDLRKMGGLRKSMPITHMAFLCGWLAIIGIPPFAGFFSKDEILFDAYMSPLGGGWFYVIGLVASACTAFYMTRLMALTFWGKSRVAQGVHPHEAPLAMTLPLVVLAILSVVGGWIGIPRVFGTGFHNIWSEWLAPEIHGTRMAEAASAIELGLMGISVSVAALSAIAAVYCYLVDPAIPKRVAERMGGLYRAVAHAYFVDEFIAKGILRPIVDGSRTLWASVDVAVFDGSTEIAADATKQIGSVARTLQNGNMQQYALYIALGVVGLLFFVMS